jgi:RNA polymerase sigma-70 factor, ECF subfamily
MNSRESESFDAADAVRRARAGDVDAFGLLMKAYHDKVYGILIGMIRHADDARDVSQQVWVKVWNKLDSFKGDADFYTWLYRVASFAALDFIRKRNRKQESGLLEEIEPARSPDSETAPSVVSRPDKELEQAEVQAAFNAALDLLSPEHRLALTLREVEGMAYDEIARVMKCRKGTVMSRIFYARKHMQEHLREWHS